MTLRTPNEEYVSVQAEYRREIDGLRAISISAVIVNHFGKDMLPNGHLGVDTFFVISGYVITLSLIGTPAKSLGSFLLNFYTKRVKRLVPALVLCVLISAVAVCLFSQEPSDSLKTGATSLFGLSNVYLLRASADYFAPATEFNVFTHTWSLGVEEQFYLVFPLMLWWLWLGRPRRATRRGIGLVLAIIASISLCAFLEQQRRNPTSAFYFMPLRFWEIGSGCLVALMPDVRRVQGQWVAPSTALVLTSMAVTFALPFEFSVPATVFVVACTVWLIAFLRPGYLAHRILSAPVSVAMGTVSYSLYLWHWSVLSLSRWTVGIHWWTAPIQLLMMLCLAWASYRWVERPLRRAKWARDGAWTLTLAATGLGAAATVLFFLLFPAKGRLFVGTRYDERSVETGGEGRSSGHVLDLTSCNIATDRVPGKAFREKPLVDGAFVRRCLEAAANSRKMVVIGDSFAQVTAPSLAVIAKAIGYEFRVLVGYACPYPLPFSQIESANAESCGQVDEVMLRRELIASLRPGDLLALRLYLEKPQYLRYGFASAPSVYAYDSALKQLASDVRGKGATLLLIGSNPTLAPGQVNVLVPQWFNALSRADASLIQPSNNRETRLYHVLDRHLREEGHRLGLTYLSLSPILCDDSKNCRTVDGGVPLYQDAQHLSPHAHALAFDTLVRSVRLVAGL